MVLEAQLQVLPNPWLYPCPQLDDKALVSSLQFFGSFPCHKMAAAAPDTYVNIPAREEGGNNFDLGESVFSLEGKL